MSHPDAYRFSHQTLGCSGGRCVPQPGDVAASPLGVPAGGCKLGAGRALTLHARHAGMLSIQHGRVWLTFNNAGQDLRVRAGDHFLNCGESLSLPAGGTVVIESYGLGHAPSAYFSWGPAPASRGEADAPAGGLGLAGVMGRAVTRAATAFAIRLAAFRTRNISTERSFKTQTCK